MTLRLLPGAALHPATQALLEVETAALNLSGRGFSGDAAVYAYLEWAIESTQILRGHFEAGSVDKLLLTKRYWHSQSAGHVDLQMASRLVAIEVTERASALRRQRENLLNDVQRWSRGKLLVLDTSALVQGPKLWEWDPSTTLGIDGVPIHLVIPILVLDELDDLKESTKQHTRNRARATLKWVAERLGGTQSARIREGSLDRDHDNVVVRVHGEIFLDILLDEPGHRRLPIADDEIVDRASHIASASGREVTLITDDVSQAYRARLAGLSVSMVEEPIYDVDVQQAARAAKHAFKERQRASQSAAHAGDAAPIDQPES